MAKLQAKSRPNRAAKAAARAAVPAIRPASAATRRRVRQAVLAASSKMALDPVVLDVRALADFCDFFFLCHGANLRQVETIAEAVEFALQQQEGLRPARREGRGEWIVLDYLDFIVHVFSPRSRRFYDLERLWNRAPRLPLPAAARPQERP
ncbi:MAG: ribosome silencing factor [Terriglobales bacterium]